MLLERIHEIKIGNAHNREKKNTPDVVRKRSEDTSTTKEGHSNAQKYGNKIDTGQNEPEQSKKNR